MPSPPNPGPTILPKRSEVEAALDPDHGMNIAPGIPGIDMSYPSTKLRFVVAANDPTKAQNFAAIYETMFGPETNTLPPTLIGGAYPLIHTIQITKPGSIEVTRHLLDTCGAHGVLQPNDTGNCFPEASHVLASPCSALVTYVSSTAVNLDDFVGRHVHVEGTEVNAGGCTVLDVTTGTDMGLLWLPEVRDLMLWSYFHRCNGGSSDGDVCASDDDCPGALCEPRPEEMYLEWCDGLCPDGYDVIRGDLSRLSEEATTIDLGSVVCGAEDLEAAPASGPPVLSDPPGNPLLDSSTPAFGERFFYLVRADARGQASIYGTSSSGLVRQPSAGDCSVSGP